VKLPQALRAFSAFALGVFITFSQSHSAEVGLWTLALMGIAIAITPLTTLKNKTVLLELLPLAVVGLLVGALSAMAILVPSQLGHFAAFVSLVTAFGLISGAFELFQAGRLGFRSQVGKDLLISASFALALGALFLIVELDVISAVGFFGAYLALSGVHLGIAAFTPQTKK
jgi:hypothetical protein